MPETQIIQFSFNGRLAEEHRLDFYESSRFQYGAARLIYTIDRYIETGKVPQKVSPKAISSKYRVAPPEKGSWVLDVLQNLPGEVVGGVVTAPIVYGLGYVYRLLFPAQKRAETAADILNSLNSGADAEEIRLFLKSYDKTKENELIEMCIAKLGALPNSADVIEITKSLVGLKQQRIVSDKFEEHMGGISYDDSERLIKKARTQIAEIGYPLSKSASSLTITDSSQENSKGTEYVINHRDVVSLSENEYEDKLLDFTVIVKSFDKETGWGKLRLFSSDDTEEVFSFLVKRQFLKNQKDDVLDAMKDRKVLITGSRVLTPAKTLKYIVFNEYLGPAE